MDKTIIIGLGNPIMSDDSVGMQVVRRVRDTLGEREDVTFAEASVGGMRLMDFMVGFDRAIIVDAMVTGLHKPGTVKTFLVTDLITTKNTISSHDTNLSTALEAGRICGLQLPSQVNIFGIEARDVNTCSEVVSEDVGQAVPIVADRIINLLSCGRDV
jgi:hydrogenase maturation protease